MDSKAIETLAINAVRDSIVLSDFLDQFITDNDKEPSWDGFVYIYNGNSRKKEMLKGRLPVQVKGTENSDLSKDEISYSVEVTDLRNYLYDGGIVFFVVYIGNNGLTKKIYYAELPPIKLRLLLSEAKEQKTKVIKLKEFPTDGNQKATIFLNCYNNCQKQASFFEAQLLSLEQLEEQGVLEGITIPVYGYGIKADPQEAFFKNEVYIYAKIKGSAIPQPLELIPMEIQTSQEINAKISVNNVPFYNTFTRTRSADRATIKIGDSFEITINAPDKSCKVNYKTSDKMRMIVKDLRFMLAILDTGKFELDGHDFLIPADAVDLSNFGIEQQKEMLDYYEKIVRVLDILGANGDLPISKLTDSDWRNLAILIKAFIDKEYVSGLKLDLNLIHVIQIGGFKFALVFSRCEEKEDTYNILDFFKTKLEVQYNDENDMAHPISQYSILHANDFLELSNIRFDVLLPSYQDLSSNPHIFERANWVLLELLLAYDKTNGSKSILLNTAKDFAEWLMSAPEDVLPYKVRLLNKLQIIRREREFSIDEVKELYAIIEDSTSREEVLVGGYLLLGSQEAAEIHFAKLDPKLQEDFKTWPIYKFWTRTKEEQHGQT